MEECSLDEVQEIKSVANKAINSIEICLLLTARLESWTILHESDIILNIVWLINLCYIALC